MKRMSILLTLASVVLVVHCELQFIHDQSPTNDINLRRDRACRQRRALRCYCCGGITDYRPEFGIVCRRYCQKVRDPVTDKYVKACKPKDGADRDEYDPDGVYPRYPTLMPIDDLNCSLPINGNEVNGGNSGLDSTTESLSLNATTSRPTTKPTTTANLLIPFPEYFDKTEKKNGGRFQGGRPTPSSSSGFSTIPTSTTTTTTPSVTKAGEWDGTFSRPQQPKRRRPNRPLKSSRTTTTAPSVIEDEAEDTTTSPVLKDEDIRRGVFGVVDIRQGGPEVNE